MSAGFQSLDAPELGNDLPCIQQYPASYCFLPCLVSSPGWACAGWNTCFPCRDQCPEMWESCSNYRRSSQTRRAPLHRPHTANILRGPHSCTARTRGTFFGGREAAQLHHPPPGNVLRGQRGRIDAPPHAGNILRGQRGRIAAPPAPRVHFTGPRGLI